MAVQDYKINYKSDFVLTINGDAGWAIPFCIKFWTGMPSQAYFVGFDGVKYVNCRVGDTPTQLLVMFDDHHLPIGKLKMQIAYHTTIEEFPGSVFDEVTNARDVIVTIDGTDYQVLLDFTGEDAPELEFDLPAYANEAERIQNELQRQQNEAARIAAELQREQATAAAVQGAENVNAQLNGTTLTVTNRQGVSTSVNTKGEQGVPGPVGPEGPQGEQGVSIVSFRQVYASETATYYSITFSDGHEQSVAIPKGAKGDTGATGPTGPQGPQGQTGVSITGFVETGETETDTLYNTTFSDSTTQQVAIPKGAKGDTGEQGPVGPQGPQGPMGDVAVITPEQQAAFTMYSTTGQNTNGPMTQKAVTDVLVADAISYDNSQSGLAAGNVQGALDETGIGLKTLEQTSPINTYSEAESDLDVADEFGKVLARFENGNVKTKYFNSENAVEAETYPTIQEDLDIADEDKKVLVRLKNGHIQTKYFDSSVGRGAYSSSTIRFEVDVNVNMLKDSEDSASAQDSYVGNYKDNGILMLPPTYTPQGKPIRLVIAFHGGGGGASDHDSQTEQQTQYKYLVANGYAVMDMNGMPADWVETWWGDCPAPSVKEYCKVNNMGTSLAMECYIKGYEWVIDNYNIARDGVFICGGSMGGMSSSNFVMMGSVPVIAQAIYAPALDTYNQAFLHPWTPVSNPVLSKYCLGKLYGFSKDGNDQYIYDADKVTGYNPIINGMESYANGERVTSVGTYDFTTHYLNGVEVTEYKRYPCPLKIWHCDNDPTVNIACSIRQVTAIKNAGGMAWLRRFPSGGHAPDTAGTVVSNPSGNTILNGASVGSIYPLAEETLLFFNRFNNK